MTENEWLQRAALYELLAFGLRLPTPELAEAVAGGEFADALAEIGGINGLAPATIEDAVAGLAGYKDAEQDGLFHQLRAEYTRLFVGAPEPAVSPYAGIWWAKAQGVQPLLFVNTRSMGVERYMRSFGIGQAEGKNEPLDHIATMLEFLQYLAMVLAGTAEPQEGVTVTEQAIGDCIRDFMADWVHDFVTATVEKAREPFYKSVAQTLDATLRLTL
jgi:TorA maturation chaperone TorD